MRTVRPTEPVFESFEERNAVIQGALTEGGVRDTALNTAYLATSGVASGVQNLAGSASSAALRIAETLAKKTVKDFLTLLDRFHTSAQGLGAGTLAVNGLASPSSSSSSAASTTSSPSMAPSVRATDPLYRVYYQMSLISLIYGLLGLVVLAGIFMYAKCTGKAQQVGWAKIILDNFNGSRLPHFFAHLSCLIGGIVGLISLSIDNGNNDGIYILPTLMLLSSILNGSATTEIKPLNAVESDAEQTVSPQMIVPEHGIVTMDRGPQSSPVFFPRRNDEDDEASMVTAESNLFYASAFSTPHSPTFGNA